MHVCMSYVCTYVTCTSHVFMSHVYAYFEVNIQLIGLEFGLSPCVLHSVPCDMHIQTCIPVFTYVHTFHLQAHLYVCTHIRTYVCILYV